MGKNPSIIPVYDDHGNQTGVIESGPTESQKLKGYKPEKKTDGNNSDKITQVRNKPTASKRKA